MEIKRNHVSYEKINQKKETRKDKEQMKKYKKENQ